MKSKKERATKLEGSFGKEKDPIIICEKLKLELKKAKYSGFSSAYTQQMP